MTIGEIIIIMNRILSSLPLNPSVIWTMDNGHGGGGGYHPSSPGSSKEEAGGDEVGGADEGGEEGTVDGLPAGPRLGQERAMSRRMSAKEQNAIGDLYFVQN